MNKKKKPSKKFMRFFYAGCIIVIFVGALLPMSFAWTIADITMGGMTLINIPCCAILSGVAVKALRDYEKQKKKGLNPVFRGRDIGLDESKLSFWK
jgi:AGCS family alanine or glycine:cation symporter